MSDLGLRFLGVGNAQAVALGSSAAVLEAGERPSLLIDCGPHTVSAYLEQYGALPSALFITHAHLDHIGGLEGLFYRLATAAQTPAPVRLFVPVSLVSVLQRRLADYPSLLAEGGCNFWDVFQLIPVSETFWHRGLSFTVFPVRHHEYLAAFGLALEGVFLFTGDTCPIPEVLNRFARRGEWVFHDCSTAANPSHTALDEIRIAYNLEQWRRMVFYHYASERDGEQIERAGFRIAHPGERFPLERRPGSETVASGDGRVQPLPGAVGW
ncbi:MAG: MBL fold metallo-hydrolase [Gammaproteobacteria bacterium]|jgi:ribonuclease BN (tRNA processing enzyme)|nr:MBL fold metallo-hydrolase [Gammaproteobacteria bacterium]